MSGGVDSSYCAHLLLSQGYEVIGLYLKLHDKEKKHEIYIKNCEQVASQLGIHFEVVDLREEFKKNVYDIGLYLKLHDKEKKHEIYIKNCEQVASQLGIHFEVVDLREEFKKNVYDAFIKS